MGRLTFLMYARWMRLAYWLLQLYNKENSEDRMNIRKTRKEDVPVIMDLYENAKAFMRSKGNLTQWNDGYPSVEIISEDIDNGNSYVFVENDEIVGTFAFIIGEDPTYQVIEDGEWHSSKIYGTIHRIACTK